MMRFACVCRWVGGVVSLATGALALAQCPLPPVVVSASGSCEGVVVQWAGTAAGTTGLQLLRSSSGSAGDAVVVGSAPATGVGLIADNTGAAGVSYTYFLRATTGASASCPAGLGALSGPLVVGRRAPVDGAPTGVRVVGSCELLVVSFDPVMGAEGYAVYTSLTPTLQAGAVPAGTSGAGATTLSVPPPAGGGTVYVLVAAVNSCGQGPLSGAVAVSLGTPPAAVARADVYGTGGVGDCSQLRLSWEASAGATSYVVLSGQALSNLDVLATVDAPATSLAVALPAGQTRLAVRVLAQNACGLALTGASAEFDRLGVANVVESPMSVAADAGTEARLSARIANGRGIVWRRDGVALSDGAEYQGAQTPVLVVPRAAARLAGVYTVEASGCVVTGSGPAVSAAAVLGVREEWSGSGCRADSDGDGVRTIDDVFVYLNLWFAGCP